MTTSLPREEERKKLKIELQKVVNEHEATLQRLVHENTASARELQKSALAQEDRFSKRFIYYLAALWSLAGIVYVFLATFTEVANGRTSDTVLGFLMGTIVSTIINYFFGSALRARPKTLLKMTKTKKQATYSEVPEAHRTYVRTAFSGQSAETLYFTQEHDGSLLAFSNRHAALARQQLLNHCYGTQLSILTYNPF